MTLERGPVPPHWIKHNLASRWPHRWIVIDTESKWATEKDVTVHTWRLGAAAWWDHNTKRHAEPEYAHFCDPLHLWTWITEHCTPEGRTIAYAHNLGFDVQISRMFESLPQLGWALDWFNIEREATMVTWRRGKQSLVVADSMTVLPAALAKVGGLIGVEKLPMPDNDAPNEEWAARCKEDVRILATALRTFHAWAREFDVGNWRASGSGLAWSMWRHKFMTHKILARSGEENQSVERDGMLTGRAEAWRIGDSPDGGLYSWDMARCYCTIAQQCDLPTRHIVTVPALTVAQYRQWREKYAVLSRVTVTQTVPIVGVAEGSGFRWPIGTFETTLWDPEIDLLLEHGARVELGESRRYLRGPALRAWADWTLHELQPETQLVPDVVALWVKSQSRSLIGRLGMRYHSWEEHPDGNGLDIVGISKQGGPGQPIRTLVHLGGHAWIEGDREDSDDCVPSITGWIMSEARRRLWLAMQGAGVSTIWHVDTDGLLVDADGHLAMRAHAERHPKHGWLLKRGMQEGQIRGTRNYTLRGQLHIAGVPNNATAAGDGTYEAEQWSGVRSGLRAGQLDRVYVRRTQFQLTARDSRRVHTDEGGTRAYVPGEFDALTLRDKQPQGRPVHPRP